MISCGYQASMLQAIIRNKSGVWICCSWHVVPVATLASPNLWVILCLGDDAMWAADCNVHWLARLADAALGFASGRRGPHQASSVVAAFFSVEIDDGVDILRCNSQIRSLGALCYQFCRFKLLGVSGGCWHRCSPQIRDRLRGSWNAGAGAGND